MVDLGCGNAYLTFAAHRYLAAGARAAGAGRRRRRQGAVAGRTTPRSRRRSGIADEATFVQATIGVGGPADARRAPDVVLALHACDTATDDALAQAVRWEAPAGAGRPVLPPRRRRPAAGPRQPPAPYSRRWCATASCASGSPTPSPTRCGRRCCALEGYRVDVVEFVESRHTPRNTLLRAVRTGAGRTPAARDELDELTASWGVRPALQELLA